MLPYVPWPPVPLSPFSSRSLQHPPLLSHQPLLCPLPLSESQSSGAPLTKSWCVSLNPCSCLCSHISLEDPLLSLSPTPFPHPSELISTPSLASLSPPPPCTPHTTQVPRWAACAIYRASGQGVTGQLDRPLHSGVHTVIW